VGAAGAAGYLRILGFLTTVLQLRYELHDVVADGDKVAIRATAHGVHNSDHLGFAATGKPYAMPTMHLYRQQGGVLVEHWGVRDELEALWQVGALTRPAPLAGAL
jgi:predicted ester cyclase